MATSDSIECPAAPSGAHTRPAWELADDIREKTTQIENLLSLVFEKMEEIEASPASSTLYTLLFCIDGYVEEVRQLCEQSQEGGV